MVRPQGAPRGRAAGDKIDRASRVGNWGGWARQRVRLARVPAIRGHREGVPARPPVRGARKAVWLGRGRDECLGVGVRGREETCPTPQTRDVQVGNRERRTPRGRAKGEQSPHRNRVGKSMSVRQGGWTGPHRRGGGQGHHSTVVITNAGDSGEAGGRSWWQDPP